MKVSIITICYNRVRTIGETITSVLGQDYSDIEYIIVDGDSSDGTKEKILETIVGKEDKVKYISEPDSGLYDALNKGVRMATGDVVGICHSDDVLFSADTVSLVAAECAQTQCDLLYADGLFVDASDSTKVIRRWISGRYSNWKVRHGWLPLHTTCYIRREYMLAHGLYDTQYRIVADTDLLLRYLLDGEIKVAYLPEFVTRMRMGGVSTNTSFRKKMWVEDVKVYANHGFKFPTLKKIEKVLWKVPQFVSARLHN